MALNCNSLGGEAEPSTMGRAGVTLRPPIVAVRSIGGGIVVDYLLVCDLACWLEDIVMVIVLLP